MALLEKLHERAEKPGYIGFLSLLAFVDYLTVFVPIDAILIMGVVIQPAKWLRIGLAMALTSTLGAMGIVALVSWSPNFLHEHFAAHPSAAEFWSLAASWIKTIGPWALIVSALAPIPQHPVLILSALGGVAPVEIAAAFGVGRLIKFVGMSYLSASSPLLLAKMFPRLKIKLRQLGYEMPS